MKPFLSRFRRGLTSRTIALSAVIAVLVGVPVGFAIAHRGFPVTDVSLRAEDVWVTGGDHLLAGRLNKQIEELNGSVALQTADVDVMQSGDTVFLHDENTGTVGKVNPAYTDLRESIATPKGAEVAYGGGTMAVLDPSGKLFLLDTSQRLTLNASRDKPALSVGKKAKIAVSNEGTVFVASPAKKRVYTIKDLDASGATKSDLAKLKDFDIAAAGEKWVVLDRDHNTLVREGGSTKLPKKGLQLQESGRDGDRAVVASADGLMITELGSGDVKTERIDGAKGESDVPRPVLVDGCAQGAWGQAHVYGAVCDGKKTRALPIGHQSPNSKLVFRVNRNIVVLNDMADGNSWVPARTMRLVRNWKDVLPEQETDAPDGHQKASEQSFEDTLANRTTQNNPPTARDDQFGARAGMSTVLSPLDNDTDPDGDVLTIPELPSIPADFGTLQLIDDARALQFTPASGASGQITFRYTASDGRGGTADANVTVSIVPPETDNAPVQTRTHTVTVWPQKTISYNVMPDWHDPDGDAMFLASAHSEAGDQVQFTPDGRVTVTATGAQLGQRTIDYEMSDGQKQTAGKLTVNVKPDQGPVGTPDFGSGAIAEPVTVHPLENDFSPSGDQLRLSGATLLDGKADVRVDQNAGTVTLTAQDAGTFYVKYEVQAGENSSVGIIRYDVVDTSERTSQPPVAVRDTAYVRPEVPTRVDALANDSSPSGKVLAIQSIDVPQELRTAGVKVEMLQNSILRVSTNNPIAKPMSFSYTMSDGKHQATAMVAVVPVPPLVTHQAPDAETDFSTVRVGDVTTISPLDNDSSPDGASLNLDHDLKNVEIGDGLAFVSGNKVRIQAPTKAGDYHATYGVTDQFGEKAAADLVIHVNAEDAAHDQAPVPPTRQARVFAGASVRIEVPVNGVDPDGDSVQLAKIVSPTQLGSVSDLDSSSFNYTAFPTASGTETVQYSVVDTYGKSAQGTVQIGVIPRPEQAMNPVANDDPIYMRPGRTTTVDVKANDSDPNGYPITLNKKLGEITKPKPGTKAAVDGDNIVITAPDTKTSFSVPYTISNGHGGQDTAYVQVAVTPDAPLRAPTAVDQVVQPKQVIGKDSVDVNPLTGAVNPGGKNSELKVSLIGNNAKAGDILTNGHVRVKLGGKRQVIAYQLDDERDNLQAAAFIIVPPKASEAEGQLPYIKPGLPKQVTPQNQRKTWDVNDVVYAPSGRKVKLIKAETATATESDGTKVFADENHLQYSPRKDFRGEASVTFTVTDGESADDPKGNVATLTMQVTVGDPQQRDIAPQFIAPNLSVEQDQEKDYDLRQSTSHPNPAVVKDVQYSDVRGGVNGVTVTASGSVLHIKADRHTASGTQVPVTFTMKYRQFTSQQKMTIVVVKTSKPAPVVVPDSVNAQRSRAITVDVLANDINPFPDVPLKITEAHEVSNTGAYIDAGDHQIKVTPGPTFIGTVSIDYTVQDDTNDPTRQRTGRLTVVVRDRPDAPRQVTVADASSGKNAAVSVRFQAGASNGAAITQFKVRLSNGDEKACGLSGCTFTGLKFGTAYSATVSAENALGWSNTSQPSNQVTPIGIPGDVTGVQAKQNAANDPSKWTATWSAPKDTGGRIEHYEVQVTAGGSGSQNVTGTQAALAGQADVTTTFQVRACNSAGCGGWAQASFTPQKPAPPAIKLSKGQPASDQGYPDSFYFYLDATGFTPKTGYQVYCYANNERYESEHNHFNITTDAKGEYHGQAEHACFSGYPGTFVKIQDTKSNVVDAQNDW